jgi:DNA-directed RNA polymerase specialized sigma24 family protein
MKDKEIARDYKSIREDYRWDGSIFSQEPDRTARVKWIIDNRLTEVERILILLYVDCQSYRKLGQRLGLSHQTCAKEVRRIREKILDEYAKLESK